MSGPTIFISAYRNFSIRYILYSDIFKVLKESGLEIVIFVKDKDVGYYQEKLGSENVTVVPILYDHVMNLLKSNRLSRFFVLIRKFMSGSTSEQVNVTDKARLYQYTKEIPTRPVTYLKFQIIRFLATVGNRWLAARRILVALESRIFNGRIYNKYFFKHNPQILIISSLGYMIDPYLMRAAKRFGCRIISIVHSWDNTSGKDYRGGEPNYVIAWNEIMKKEINIFHDFPEERIHVGGVAHWDFYFNNRIRPRQKEDFLKSYGLSENRKIIFYGLSNARWFPRSFDVIEIILKEIEYNRFVYPVQLMVRLHPYYLHFSRNGETQIVDDYCARMESLKKRYGKLVIFTLPMMEKLNADIDMPIEDMHKLAEALRYSDILLNEYSTLIIEASILDLPIINVALFNLRDTDKPVSYIEKNFTHINRILSYGATKNAYTSEQLFMYINDYLKNPSLEMKERAILVNHEITTNRGCAGKEIGKLLWKYLL